GRSDSVRLARADDPGHRWRQPAGVHRRHRFLFGAFRLMSPEVPLGRIKMTTPIANALIVGGGFSGMAAAIQLRKLGVAVDLLEFDPQWRSYGAGISIGGPTLRAFRTLGVLERFLEEGYACDGLDILSSGGHLLAQIPTPRIAGDQVPGSGAVMRPVLARILADATRACGTQVRLGCSFSGF